MNPRHMQIGNSEPKSGFALVIAISLMAFVVLLLVSLVTIVRVEIASADITQVQLKARLNAQLGVMIALGELQKYAGPDQRVSARADIEEDSSASVATIEHPIWTGIWNADPDSPDYRNLPPAYIVSGNEQFDMNGLWNAGTTEYPSGYFLPDQTLTDDNSVLLQSGSMQTGLTTNTVVDVDIRAPIVEIESEDSFDDSAYAYWVSDEGVRANVRRDVASNSTTTDNEALLSADTNKFSLLNNLTGFDEFSAGLDRMESLSELPLLNNAYAPALVDYGYDLTFYSRSLLTNTKEGGLRKNLTAGLGPDDDEFQKLTNYAGTQIFGPQWSSDVDKDPGGPDWSLLRDFQANATGDAELVVRPQLNDQAGFFPVLTYFHNFYHAAYTGAGNAATIRLLFFPAAVLWNPYNRPLPAQTYYLLWNPFRFGGAWSGVLLGDDDEITDHIGYKVRVAGLEENNYNQFGAVVYRIESSEIGPGEAIVFRPDESAAQIRGHVNGAINGGNVLTPGSPTGGGFFPNHFYNDLSSQSPIDLEAKYGSISASDWTVKIMTRDNWPSNDGSSGSGNHNGQMLNGQLILSDDPTNEGFFEQPLQLYSSVYAWGTGFSSRAKHEFPLLEYNTLLSGGESNQDFPRMGVHVWMKFTSNALSERYSTNDDFLIEPSRFLAIANPRSATMGQSNLDDSGFKQSVILENAATNAKQDFWSFQSDGINAYVGHEPNVSKMTLFDVRNAESWSSIGELMHAPLYRSSLPLNGGADVLDIQRLGLNRDNSPAYAVGNSLVHPWIAEEDDEASIARAFRHNWPVRDGVPDAQEATVYDSSYLLNEALWDRYFFTSHDARNTLPGDAVSFPLVNARLESTEESLTYDDLEDFDLTAETLFIDGGFNINSTSLAAWQTLYSSFLGSEVTTAEGLENNELASPILRSSFPMSNKADPLIDKEFSQNVYNGYRALTSDEIDSLAEETVKQVKLRGPFRSLSDFVNRSIDPSDPLEFKEKGALQAAIDEAGLNDYLSATEVIESAYDKVNTNGVPIFRHYEKDYLTGQVTDGTPGSITQADILARAGGIVSPRSDTFTIVSQGMVKNSLTGEPDTVATLEATVQRVVDKIDPDTNELNYTEPSSGFGRQFKIVSTRWINLP